MTSAIDMVPNGRGNAFGVSPFLCAMKMLSTLKNTMLRCFKIVCLGNFLQMNGLNVQRIMIVVILTKWKTRLANVLPKYSISVVNNVTMDTISGKYSTTVQLCNTLY